MWMLSYGTVQLCPCLCLCLCLCLCGSLGPLASRACMCVGGRGCKGESEDEGVSSREQEGEKSDEGGREIL
jgi:hypothetical protein